MQFITRNVQVTDFSVLQPAIDHYCKHGNATEKLRTLYYQGRIYQNQGNDAAAMACYIDALDVGMSSNDILTQARLYVAQGNIYFNLLKWDKVCETSLNAAELFNREKRTGSYVNCLLKAANSFVQKGDFENAALCFNKCKPLLNTISQKLSSKFQSEYIIYLNHHSGTSESIKDAINSYLSSVPESLIDYITVANAYIKLGEYDKALNAISHVQEPKDIVSKIRYYATFSEINASSHKYKEALDNYKLFNELDDYIILSIFEQETQFSEERHILEIQAINATRSRNRTIFYGVLLCILLTSVIFFIYSQLRIRTLEKENAKHEIEKYKSFCQTLEEEKEELLEVLSETNIIDTTAKDIIQKRIDLLNKFFSGYISGCKEISDKATREIEDLLGRKKEFMHNTMLAFTGSYPKFIGYLKDRGLTDREIEYCCLYALGLRGKEVAAYTQKSGHYNSCSTIREKLGLDETGTNLGIHIRKLLRSTI